MRCAITPLVVSVLLGMVGCALPRRDAALPREENFVAVLSGEMPAPIDVVSRHSWIVTHFANTSQYKRFELGGDSSSDPYQDFAKGDVMVHGVVAMGSDALEETEKCLHDAKQAYAVEFPSYFPIPGPNSNTLVAYLLRHCNVHIELPSTAIGRDYMGAAGAQVTEASTGIAIGTFPLGLRLGLQEGVEVQLMGLPFGLHFWPPGITVPVNPGRIGFATDGHTVRPWAKEQSEQKDAAERVPDLAIGSVTMSAQGATTTKASRAGGLEQTLTVGMSARGLYGGRVGYGFGLEFEAGAARPLGFAGMIHAFPAGIGYALSPTGFIGFFSGIGTSGVTGSVPAGLDLPQELRLQLDAGRLARLVLTARGTFIVGREARQQGQFGFHETQFGVFAHFGKREGGPQRRETFASGHFFGLERREVMGSAFLGLVFGTQIDASMRDHRRTHDRDDDVDDE